MGPRNQSRLGQFSGSKQPQRNFEQWPLCNECKGRHLGDCNDAPRCYNCGRVDQLARDGWNCYNCGKSSHLMKDCLNCYSCGKPRHFARDCPEQDKSTPKQGNTRDGVLAQRDADSGTSQVVAGQISIVHTSACTLINFGA